MIEILGILIGFCSIMLMFSILVTSIVQGISSVINLRAWNLTGGLLSFANKVVSLDGVDQFDEKLQERLIRLIDANIGVLKRKVGFVSYEQVSDAITELYSENLKDNTKFTIKNDIEKKIKAYFERIEDEMAARFQTWMNSLSIAVALIVVCMFQVNSLELLKKLSLNEDYRHALVAYSENAVPPSMLIDSKEIFLNINEQVNKEFINKYVKTEPLVEQLSAVGNEDLDDALLDFSNALDGSPEFLQAHYGEYKKQITTAMKAELKKAQVEISTSMNELAEFDFEPLPNDWGYFVDKDNWFKNWVGLLMSTVLVSLGAPFWFSTVRNLIGLRDALSSRKASQSDTTSSSQSQSSTPILKERESK
jgi:hypothetical protein